jgi:hypothetical protein
VLHVICSHYSYVPPSTPQFPPPQLTHTQAAPRSFQRTRPNQEQQHYAQAPQAPTPHRQRAVPPPNKFKPAKMTSASNKPPFDPNSQIHTHRHSGQQQGGMGPPPTPLHVRQKQSVDTTMHINHANPNSASTSDSLQVHPVNTHPRLVPPDQPLAFPQRSVQSQPPTPSTGTSQRFMPPLNMSRNQRIPFVPGAHGGFT